MSIILSILLSVTGSINTVVDYIRLKNGDGILLIFLLHFDYIHRERKINLKYYCLNVPVTRVLFSSILKI